MAQEYSYIDALKSAREAQQKFDYYFMGVVLATISLSIQSKPGCIAICLLYSSWILWLISLAAGFVRLERMISFLRVETESMHYKTKQNTMEAAKRGDFNLFNQQNEPWTDKEIDEETRNIEEIIGLAKKYTSKHVKYANHAYPIFKWCYFVGVVTYVVYRVIN